MPIRPIFTSLLALLSTVRCEHECDSDAILKCGYHFVSLLEPDPPEKEYLRENCGKIMESIKCHEDLKKRCDFETPLSKKLSSLLVEMCDEDSTIGKEYLEQRKCFNTLSSEMSKCQDINVLVMDFATDVENRNSSDSMEERSSLNLDCLLSSVFRECFEGVIEEKCGPEAKGNLMLMIRERTQDDSCVPEETDKWLRAFWEYAALNTH